MKISAYILVILLCSFSIVVEGQSKKSSSVKVAPFKIGQKAGDTWTNSKGMVFCWCPPGEFTMNGKTVKIKDGYWIARYEWTKGKWTGKGLNRKSMTKDKDDPVVFASIGKSFADAIRKLNTAEAGKFISKDWEYSVPTTEQWEYAARAGSKTRFFFGDDVKQLPKYANFADKAFYDSKEIYSSYGHRSLNDGIVKLGKVGQYKPNAWGLYDVYGNAAEWCHGNIYRGGSWLSLAEYCNSEFTDKTFDRFESNYIGARLVIRKKGSIPNPKNKK